MPDATDVSLKPVLAPEAWALLNSLPPYSSDTADEMNITLRKQGRDPQTVAAVLTQLRLRRDAQSKFGSFAARMLFTPDGLQQSTRLPVAARHARRFRDAGLKHVADLGCGLGADSLAFASLGMRVTSVEADETTAAAAYINLRPFPEAHVVHSTAQEWADDYLVPAFSTADSDGTFTDSVKTGLMDARSGVWLDPARRNQRSRLWDPEEFSPPLSFATELASTGIPLGVKLGPGIPHELIPSDCEAEWVSLDGDLVEVVLWFNALARRAPEGSLIRRAASVLTTQDSEPPSTGLSPVRVVELPSNTEFGNGISLPASGPEGLSGILWEPDSAVLRAGLVAELCEQFEGRMLDEHIAYFCTDLSGGGETPLARGYRVLEVMAFSAKRLKQWCTEQQITSVEIKKRGVDVVPEQLRKQILPKRTKGQPKSSGSHATLIITRLRDERLAAVVEPLPRSRQAAPSVPGVDPVGLRDGGP